MSTSKEKSKGGQQKRKRQQQQKKKSGSSKSGGWGQANEGGDEWEERASKLKGSGQWTPGPDGLDPRYVRLDDEGISILLNFTVSDSAVNIAYTLLSNAFLAGGVRVRKKNEDDDEISDDEDGGNETEEEGGDGEKMEVAASDETTGKDKEKDKGKAKDKKGKNAAGGAGSAGGGGDEDFKDESTAYQVEDNEEEERQSRVWSEYCKQTFMQEIALGFSAAVIIPDTDPNYKCTDSFSAKSLGPRMKATTLNLERVEVFFYRDVYNQCYFKFFRKIEFPEMGYYHGGGNKAATEANAAGLFFGARMSSSIVRPSYVDYKEREIPDVRVFITHPPSNDGSFNSVIAKIHQDMLDEVGLRENCRMGNSFRANPPLITQIESKKPESSNLSITNRGDPTYGLQSYLGNGSEPGEVRKEQIASLQAIQKAHIAGFNTCLETQMRVNGRTVDPAASGASMRSRHQRQLKSLGLNELPLEEDRVLAKQTLAEAPNEQYLAFRHARLERVLLQFAAPMTMITQASSLGEGGKNSMNENAFTVYQQALREIRQRYKGYVTEMYHSINDVPEAIDYAVKTVLDKKKVPSEEGLKKAIDVEISIPGLAPEQVMSQLYQSGIIKYEGFTRYLHEMYGIPCEDFNERPALSLQEVAVGSNDEEGGEEGSGGGGESGGGAAKKKKSSSSSTTSSKKYGSGD